jgi:VanZ family protein
MIRAAGASILPRMHARPPHPVRVTRQIVVAWGLVGAWAGVLFVLSAQPDLAFVPDPRLDFIFRKLGHMAAFGILALLVWRALAGTADIRRPAVWAIALALVYAATDELHQGFVSGRHPSALDVGIDAVGILVAVLAIRIIQMRRPRVGASRQPAEPPKVN